MSTPLSASPRVVTSAIDLHTHTRRCRHATGDVAAYVAAARQRGASVIAITDHLPLPPALAARLGEEQTYSMPLAELDAYVAEVLAAREASRASGGPEVLLGIEADWAPGAEEHIERLTAAYPFDLVLGSVHFIDGWAFDDPAQTARYEGLDIDALWRRYFELAATAAGTGLFDVMAHVDLVKKFGYRPDGEMRTAYAALAGALAVAGVAAEINTAGLRKPCAELYPSPPLLAALHEAGVVLTVGSDAHAPAEVLAANSEALAAARAAGYGSLTVFRSRKRSVVPL